jgi:hypothetical protein
MPRAIGTRTPTMVAAIMAIGMRLDSAEPGIANDVAGGWCVTVTYAVDKVPSLLLVIGADFVDGWKGSMVETGSMAKVTSASFDAGVARVVIVVSAGVTEL